MKQIKIECEPEEFIELKKALGNAQHDLQRILSWKDFFMLLTKCNFGGKN